MSEETLTVVGDEPETKRRPVWARVVSKAINFSVEKAKEVGDWAVEEPRDAAIVAGATGVVVIAVAGGAVVTNAAILASLSTAAVGAIVVKSPKRVQVWMVDHSLIVDSAATLGTYFMLGAGGLTILMASAMTCVMTSAVLAVAKPIVKNGYVPAAAVA